MTPELADAHRDAYGLVRAMLAGDDDGASAILAGLGVTCGGPVIPVVFLLADLAAGLLREQDRGWEHLAGLQQARGL